MPDCNLAIELAIVLLAAGLGLFISALMMKDDDK